MKDKTCSICGKIYHEFGNNAQPINDGRCCNKCNADEVIPARLRLMQADKLSKGYLGEGRKAE